MPNTLLSAYAVTCVILCLNLLALWIGSGVARARGGIAINPEDGARYGAPLSDADPPAVARILRAHRNAEATIIPFLILALVYVVLGGRTSVAIPIFIAFVVAKILHSVLYLKGQQPGRSIAFAASALAMGALMVAIVVALCLDTPRLP